MGKVVYIFPKDMDTAECKDRLYALVKCCLLVAIYYIKGTEA